MNKEVLISIRAYAKRLAVDEKAVRRAIEEGKIEKGFNTKVKKIVPSIADYEWGNLHKIIRPQRGVSKRKVAEKMEKIQQQKQVEQSEKNSTETLHAGNYTELSEVEMSYSELIESISINPNLVYTELIRQKEILAVARAKMEIEEKLGTLVRKVDVEKNLFAIGDSLKKALLNIASRAVADIRASNSEIEGINILTIELNSALNQFAEKLKY